MSKFLFERKNFRRPDCQLDHMDISLGFFDDRVEGEATLDLTARVPVKSVTLDAMSLDVHAAAEVLPSGKDSVLPFDCRADARKLVVPLAYPAAAGAKIRLHVRTTCHPSDVRLSGIYRDVTPAGAPPQFMSQCQQYGFEEILPVIDDCTAKCTFRTTLEGDARYTHLISNGDVDLAANPSGKPEPVPGNPARKRITYVNAQRMAPYLFLAVAGTWDALEDDVVYPDTRQKIHLEYLVPPGHLDGARVPMEILKSSILWQHKTLGFSYPYRTYRTITMEKSLYGGMENVGNTTIITEAALVDASLTDRRLVYAYGVIPHEYEHNHCGSGVTMESVFDMWLNEAYTVNVERAYLKSVFDPVFIRLQEIDQMRAVGGPLAQEETGKFGRIVREGYNDPDEIVDNVTYVKAPEVLDTLEKLIGADASRAATELYFRRYAGGNANTEQFLACFDEVTGRDITGLMREWLFSVGYPRVGVRHASDAAKKTLTLTFTQTRTGHGGLFTIPVSYAAVDAAGHDIPAATGTCVLAAAKQEIVIHDVTAPAFLSFNRGGGFYGVLVDESATDDELRAQVALDADPINRVEAMRILTDHERRTLFDALLRGNPLPAPSADWLALHRRLFRDDSLSETLRGALLRIDEAPTDRALRANVRENVTIRRALLAAAARNLGVDRIAAALLASAPAGAEGQTSAAILHRAFKAPLLDLLSASDDPAAFAALDKHLAAATNITDRLNTLRAIWCSGHPRRSEILSAAGETLRRTLGGYIGYLGVVASSPRVDVFDAIAAEEARPTWSISHPGLSRALYCAMAANNAQLWTPRGLAWLEKTVVKYAAVGEYNALRLIAPCENFRSFAPDLAAVVRGTLERIRAKLPADKFPAVTGRIDAVLED